MNIAEKLRHRVITASDAHLFVLDDGGILFSESTQEIYTLNGLATFIWCCLEEGMDIAAVAHRITNTFALPKTAALRAIWEIVEQWRRLGFILNEHSRRQKITSKVSDTDLSCQVDMPPWRAPEKTSTRRYRLLTTTIQVRFTASEQEHQVRPVLAHLETEQRRPADVCIDIIQGEGRFLIYRDKNKCASVRSPNAIAPWVKSLLQQAAIERFDYILQIHAGVVGLKGGCILLPAAAGSGKSTLTAALVGAGFQYFSDEVALLEHDHCAVRPVPLALCVKSTGLRAVLPHIPQVTGFAVHNRMDGKVVRYVPPSIIGKPADPNVDCRVRWVFFPSYSPDVPPSIHPLERIEGLQQLLQECITVPGKLFVKDVSTLVSMIRSTQFYGLSYSRCDDAVSLIESVVGRR